MVFIKPKTFFISIFSKFCLQNFFKQWMYLLRLFGGYQHFFPFFFLLMFRSGIGCCSSASLVNSSIPHSVEQSGTEQKRNGESFVVAKVDHGAEVVIVPAPPLEQPPLSSLPPASATVLADQQQQHPHPKRNYASKDCGAKVLYSNAEAENRGAILNDPERDDYMRNPCERAQNKFLIIELCETIQPTALEIANFELFSSSPRQFRLWGAERYPTQEWALIGEFEALDNREVQLFNVLEQTSYAKFVKLELITHYGTEHYCTLSTFRLYGTSMVDEYEAETVAVVDPLQQQHHQQQLDSVFGRTFTNSATLNDETMVVGDEEENNRRSSNNNTTTTTGSTTTTTNHRPTDRPSVAQRCRKCLQNNILQCDWFCHVFFGPHQPQRMTELSMSNLVDSSSISALPIAKMPKSHLMEFLNRISPICPLNGNIQGAAKEQTETKKQTTDGQNQELNQQQQHQTVQQPQRPMLDTKIVDKSNLTPLPGTSSSHKESVFMKLNKRLTALEQNMSLSSEHLLELSRRCVNGAARAESELKQQREGISKEAERMAKQEANRVETEMKQKISELQHEVRRLSQQLQSVQTTVVQATGTGGFFYRPMLSRVHGYSASDSYCRGDQACLVTDAMMGTTLSSMHSTSAASYGVNSMPVPAIHPAFEGKTMDGLWTTSQVIYLMLLVQLGTLVMLKLFRVLSVRVLHQCFYAAAQPLSTMHSATTPLSSTPMASSANLTDTMMNTSQQSLPLLNSSTLS